MFAFGLIRLRFNRTEQFFDCTIECSDASFSFYILESLNAVKVRMKWK